MSHLNEKKMSTSSNPISAETKTSLYAKYASAECTTYDANSVTHIVSDVL